METQNIELKNEINEIKKDLLAQQEKNKSLDKQLKIQIERHRQEKIYLDTKISEQSAEITELKANLWLQKSNEILIKQTKETLEIQTKSLNSNKTVLTNQLEELIRKTDLLSKSVRNGSMQIGFETLKWKMAWPSKTLNSTSGRNERTKVDYYIKNSEPIILNVAQVYIRSQLDSYDDKRKL